MEVGRWQDDPDPEKGAGERGKMRIVKRDSGDSRGIENRCQRER